MKKTTRDILCITVAVTFLGFLARGISDDPKVLLNFIASMLATVVIVASIFWCQYHTGLIMRILWGILCSPIMAGAIAIYRVDIKAVFVAKKLVAISRADIFKELPLAWILIGIVFLYAFVQGSIEVS